VKSVLDASALLVELQGEAGDGLVAEALSHVCAMSVVGWTGGAVQAR
jgi:hypothetical protein